jgi:hypothetical protein
MFEAFGTLRAVHEIRWYLADAAARDLPTHLAIDVDRAAERLAEVSASAAGALAGLDVAALRGEVGDLLSRVSIVIRGGADGLELRGRDLAGRDLRAAPWHGDLRGADLRRALLLGADLRGADLRTADLLGADLRGARLDGADLTDALFLTGPQLAGALGDQATRIPDFADRPAHWP